MHRPSTVILRSPMLCLCSTYGCTVIVFGGGTCVEHDPLRMVTDQLLAQALAGGARPDPDARGAASSSERRAESPAESPAAG